MVESGSTVVDMEGSGEGEAHFGVLVIRVGLRLFLCFDIGDTSGWAHMTERAFATVRSTSLTYFATVLNEKDV